MMLISRFKAAAILRQKPISHSLGLLVICWAGLTGNSAARAHGVTIQQHHAVEIEARFDTGTPLVKAQVAVFAPDEPETPVVRGSTDADGKFQFVPDPARVGDWSVQVRSAGHGAIATVPVGSVPVNPASGSKPIQLNAQHTTQQGRSSPTAMQRVLMGASVLWGCVGTTLFFSQRSGSQPSVTRDTPLTSAAASPHSDHHAHS